MKPLTLQISVHSCGILINDNSLPSIIWKSGSCILTWNNVLLLNGFLNSYANTSVIPNFTIKFNPLDDLLLFTWEI